MLRLFVYGVAVLLTVYSTAYAQGRVRAVGSSTVYPFVTVVAEEVGRSSNKKTPIVEATGTGGGFKLFCAGVGDAHPDLSNASRAIKASEIELCKKNGISNITEIKIGFDGIVLANAVGARKYDLTTEQLFKALARKVPADGALVDNPYKKWSDIDAGLPATKIEVYGPPPTSGTRDAFVELVMEDACAAFPEFEAAYPDKNARKKACHLMREDGLFIEAGENDNLIVQKLKNNHNALGIFGYSFLDQNEAIVQGSMMNSVEPSFENIASGDYPVSRPLYVYLKDAHLQSEKGLQAFVSELVSDDAIGEEGYLTVKGLIPLNQEALASLQEAVHSKIQ